MFDKDEYGRDFGCRHKATKAVINFTAIGAIITIVTLCGATAWCAFAILRYFGAF